MSNAHDDQARKVVVVIVLGPGASSSLGFSFKSVEAGAATEVSAANAAGLDDHNGAYLADGRRPVAAGARITACARSGPRPGVNGFLPHLLDDDSAAALWQLSEELVGAMFDL